MVCEDKEIFGEKIIEYDLYFIDKLKKVDEDDDNDTDDEVLRIGV